MRVEWDVLIVYMCTVTYKVYSNLPSAPDSADCHCLVEAEEADPQVEKEQQTLGLLSEAVDGGADVDQSAQGLREPDAEEVHLEEGEVGHLAALVTHEQVVEGGAYPGSKAGCHVGPGQERHTDGDQWEVSIQVT